MANERDTVLDGRMSEHEALMWNIEKDPWLNPSGASLVLLDQPVDPDAFRRILRAAVVAMPRLYERVVPGFGRLSTPAWEPDPEFDLDYHIRFVELANGGDDRAVFDLAAQLYNEPLDRTRPLWRFVAISGLAGGRGALWLFTHHVVSDGIGQLRMAELYQQVRRDEVLPDEVDLESIVADAVATHRAKEVGGASSTGVADTARLSVEHLVRRQLGIGRSIGGELAMWPADPGRIGARASSMAELVKSAVEAIRPGDEQAEGSTLWKERSRHRRLDHVRVSLEDLKQIGKQTNATINDVFVAAIAEAAHRYHDSKGVDVDHFNSSFVLSTRQDGKVGGNAFTPVQVRLPGAAMAPTRRVEEVRDAVADARDRAGSSGGVGALSGVVNLLPTSMLTRAARAAASHMDFATSNLRGAPFELYCARAKVLVTIPMGPVAGTPANITALSYDGNFDIGIFTDPAAIADPDAFTDCVRQAFTDMGAAAT